MKYTSLFTAFIFMALAACNSKQNTENTTTENTTTETKKELTKVSLRQEFIPYSGFAGDIMAMYETDSLYGLELNVEPSSEDIDPIKMVLSGQNTFGVVGADRLIIDNQKNTDLVVIGVVNYKTPVCFIAKEEDNVKVPQDFTKVKVGIMSGTHVDYVYRVLLKKAKISQKVKEVEASYNLTSFIADTYDVHPSFSYLENTILDMKGIKYTAVWPENYGVSYIGTVYFTTRKTIQEKPEIVQAFINSITKAWEMTIDNPEKAIQYLVKYDKTLDSKTELACLKKGIPFFRGENNTLLWASDSSWTSTIDNLRSIDPKTIGLVKPMATIDLKQFVDYSFLEKYQASKK